MTGFYVFALVLGGALLLVSLFGDVFGDAGDVDGGAGHGGDAHDASAFKFFSLRTLTYFLFTFGGVGAALTWAWPGRSTVVIMALALLAGGGVALLAAALMRYLRMSESGETAGEDSFIGLPGRVVIPLSPAGVGKVLVHRGDRSFELSAQPFEQTAPAPQEWRSVVVIEMRRGTALVAPVDDLVT